MKTICSLLVTALTPAFLVPAGKAAAGEIGHFAPGVANIRDFVVPEPGIYGVLYNYFYTTDRLNDSHGNKVESVTINSGAGSSVTLGVNVDVNLYALAPTLIWVTGIKPLGIKYGAFIAPTFMNANLDAALSAAGGQVGNVDSGNFGVGDLFVQPIWLGKTTPHWDFALGYGFYAPVGKYDTGTLTLPGIGPFKVESSDNLGYGFWTHQFQGAVSWYPRRQEGGTVVALALTYETNGRKEDFDLTPGDNLTLNWGISQLQPLKKDGSLLLEVGPAGYDTWQITDDTGSAANNTRDQVHAVGGQFGVTYAPWMLSVNFHGFYEYWAVDRFQGTSFGLNISKKF